MTSLCEKTGLRESQVGLIGFCFGGGFALTSGSGWGAISTNYGEVPPDAVLRGLGKVPVIGCYGGKDRKFGGNGPVLESKLRTLGVPVETHTYPQAAHSFLTDGHHPILTTLMRPIMQVAYHPQAAQDAWEKIFTFFDQHVEKTPG